jgi:translation initiation factor 3 subunit H
LKCLRDVNADNNTVGWYQSTYLESFMNLKTIDTQYQYQLEFGNKCIHLVLDPIRTRKGQLYIKAYRLTKRFFDLVRESYREQLVYKKMMEKYNAKEDELDVAPATITGTASAVAAAAGTGTVAPATAAAAAAVEAVLAEELLDKNSLLPPTIERVHIIQEAISKLNMSFNDILEEVPIIIHNSAMVHAFLYDLSSHEQFAATSTEFDNLDLSTTSFLEKSLESLLECSTDLTNERSRYQFYQRKLAHQKYQFQKKKDKSQEEQELLIRSVQQPSQLENLMITYQIDNTCKQVNRVSGEQISKLYLINHMFRRETEEQ